MVILMLCRFNVICQQQIVMLYRQCFLPNKLRENEPVVWQAQFGPQCFKVGVTPSISGRKLRPKS